MDCCKNIICNSVLVVPFSKMPKIVEKPVSSINALRIKIIKDLLSEEKGNSYTRYLSFGTMVACK